MREMLRESFKEVRPAKSVSSVAAGGAAIADAIATVPITASGLQTIDGNALSADDSCLLIAQAAPEENTLFTVSANKWKAAKTQPNFVVIKAGVSSTRYSCTSWMLADDNQYLPLGPRIIARAATTGAISLSGSQTLDGDTPNPGDIVLVKDTPTAGTPSQRGIYLVQAANWIFLGQFWPEIEILNGTLNGKCRFLMTAPNTFSGGGAFYL